MRKIILFFLLFISLGIVSAQESVETSSLFVKASVKQGELITKTLTISSKSSGDFSLSVNSLEGVTLKQENFALEEGEDKTIELRFDAEGLDPGAYIGNLQVNGPLDSSQIPVLFEVESEDVIFDSNIDIPPAYKEVQQGSKLTYQIKIFDLIASGGLQEGVGAVNVDITYSVYSMDGKVLITKDDQLVVDKQAQLTSAIGFPEDIAVGTYILVASVKYKESVGISSQTFEINEAIPTSIQTEGRDIPNYALIGAVIIALIIFFVTLGILVYLLKERDKILGELKRFNERETKAVTLLLKEQKDKMNRKGKRNIDKEIRQKLKELRQKQQDRVYEFEKLKSVGNEKEMKNRLDYWRRKGYDTSALDYKMAGLTTREMKQILDKWKKEYSRKQKD